MTSHPLFSTFPREVLSLSRPNAKGVKIPTRSVVLSQKELDMFIRKYSGVQDLYIGSFIYKGDIGSTIVDKIPYDFDDEHSEYALKLTKWLYEHEIGYVTVGTHFDRYHVYVPIYPQRMTPLELQEAQLSLLEQAEIYRKICGKCGSAITIASGYCNVCRDNGSFYYQPMTDTHIIGDIRRVMRIPNTPRLPKQLGGEIICYCTYLPQNFYEMDKTLRYGILKQPHEMETPDFYPRPLFEIVKPLTRQFRSVVKLEDELDIFHEYVPTDPLLRFVQSILRPCIWKVLSSPNPPHFIRVAATIDLRDLDFSSMQIFDIFSRLNWIDWNPETCDYQISDILGKTYLKRYSCTKIRGAGVPCESGCQFKGSSRNWKPITKL